MAELPVEKDDHEPSREDMMLAYVAVTRAKKALDIGGLAWINDRLNTPAVRRAATGDDPWARPTTKTTPAAEEVPYVIVKHAVEETNRALGFDRTGTHLRDVG